MLVYVKCAKMGILVFALTVQVCLGAHRKRDSNSSLSKLCEEASEEDDASFILSHV